MKLFSTVKTKIKDTVKHIKYIWQCYPHFVWFVENPFYIVFNKTVLRFFSLPKVHFYAHSVLNEREWCDSVFGFYSCAISYKNKYNTWRFENEPFIQLNLFGFCFGVKLICPTNDVCEYGYWESILDLYCNYVGSKKKFNLYKIINRNTWQDTINGHLVNDDMMKILTFIGLQEYFYGYCIARQEEIE